MQIIQNVYILFDSAWKILDIWDLFEVSYSSISL